MGDGKGRRVAAAALGLFAAAFSCARAGGSLAEVDAAARAAGNRRPEAVKVGRVLFATTWPAQILKVHVDGVGSHEVAGLVLSGVKFHRPLGQEAFTDEVSALVQRSFAAAPLEEVDVWATVPIAYVRDEPVSGDYAEPTSRIVFAATVRRDEGATFAARLRRSEGVYWAPDFLARLRSVRGEGPRPGPANPASSAQN
ncbi:MAG TPA: hypothetical protein VKG44_07795 [Candidatus Baltobacteraceae bacterium]|nr:hypothetical protein [Candidatus Baltobacteraceae bacterium]